MRYGSVFLVVFAGIVLVLGTSGQEGHADKPTAKGQPRATARTAPTARRAMPSPSQMKKPPAPAAKAKRRQPRRKRARRRQGKPASVNVALRSRRPRSYFYSQVSLENRGPQSHQWQIKCPKAGQQRGQIRGFETLYFRPRETAHCTLQIQGQRRSISLHKRASWILYQGQLYASRTRTVVYPPIRPYGDVGLLKNPGYIRQWASKASASSQWSPSSYNAQQLTGPPSVTACQDSSYAWCPSKSDGGREWIKLGYAKRTNAIGVVIHANTKPGTVQKVQAWDGSHWNTVWSGADPTKGHCPGIFAIRFQHPIVTKEIRIILDTKRVPGWNEIDAVQLISQP